MADTFMLAMYFLAGSVVVATFGMVGIGIYGQMEERRIYEQKVAARIVVIRQQQKERAAKEQQERDNYAKGSK
jgi:hypothetical protein